ncbi:MAG: preprotein translocase subunit SecA [bacterium]
MKLSDLLGHFFSSATRPKEIDEINALENEIQKLSDEQLQDESKMLKAKVSSGTSLDDVLVRAFALVRETSRRTLKQRHYDVQLWGGIALHTGCVAEMSTGEGKTLAATAPIYLNALTGKGVHVITVNDYLAKRDVVWMGQIYHFLGISASCIVHDSAYLYDPTWRITSEEREALDKERDEKGGFLIKEDFLRPISRKEAYEADVTYGTSHEFGFDYLRDNLAYSTVQQSQRKHMFAIIDEVDSILIDEARTPLIISIPDKESSEYYRIFAQAVAQFIKDTDYTVDEKMRAVEITEDGINKAEKLTGIQDIYSVENIRIVHYLEASLKARALYELDRDYVVRDGEIIIVDQFTGRLMEGRRYSLGLHQAIEAKESVKVKEESRTYAQISIQNYFRMYEKLSGMTGTAQTSAEEFHKVYDLETVTIPTNKQISRMDSPDVVYKTIKAKYDAIADDIKKRHDNGQPVLIGTVSIEKNEELARVLRQKGIPCEILNAKNHEREGGIIAQAGRFGAVTVATNMAGRGVDIILGGNPFNEEEAEKVKVAGGLHVIGTERHDARRIDNQLRGRAGRQGDVGSSQFYLSLEDDLMRVFGGNKIAALMDRFDLPEDLPIENKMVTRAISQAQSRVEGFNFDARKHLLDYDDVLNKQRGTFYRKRQRLIEGIEKKYIRDIIEESIEGFLLRIPTFEQSTDTEEEYSRLVKESQLVEKEEDSCTSIEDIRDIVKNRLDVYDNLHIIGGQLASLLDFIWMNHLEDIEALAESVRIRAYGQKDPLVEYRRDGKELFERMLQHFNEWTFMNVFKLEKAVQEAAVNMEVAVVQSAVKQNKKPTYSGSQKVGRNDLCPCGSGKKYKKCHGV